MSLQDNLKKLYGIQDRPILKSQENEFEDDFEDDFEEEEDEEIEKGGGEGSRGGKVIGHTKSGKPIYEGNPSSIVKKVIDEVGKHHVDFRNFQDRKSTLNYNHGLTTDKDHKEVAKHIYDRLHEHFPDHEKKVSVRRGEKEDGSIDHRVYVDLARNPGHKYSNFDIKKQDYKGEDNHREDTEERDSSSGKTKYHTHTYHTH